MAAATSFTPSLAPPVPDDTMDMSSPANRPHDDDIEIDFGDYNTGIPLTDDEQMIEDTTRPATATDEIMDDEALYEAQYEAHVEEEVMGDDPVQIEDTVVAQDDEELIDYGEDDDLQDQIVDDTEIPNLTEDVTTVSGHIPEAELPQEQPAPPAEHTDADASHEHEYDAATTAEKINEQPAEVLASDAFDFGEPAADSHEDVAADGTGLQGEVYEDFEESAAAYEEETLRASLGIDTTLDAEAEGPDTPTDTGLHPMTVRYGDLQIPLFKSRRQLDGLLKDDNLANVSLADLMKSCRQRLGRKMGAISTDQELVLSFDHLGLLIVEDSRAAFATSLNEVLEVFLQLHENDGTEEIAPLTLTLTTQIKFESSLALLKRAGQSGQGMSAFSFLHTKGVAEQQVQEGESWEDETAHGEGEGAAEGDQAAYDQHGDDAEEYYDEHYDGDQPEDDAHDDSFDDTALEGEYHYEEQGEAADALDGLTAQPEDDAHGPDDEYEKYQGDAAATDDALPHTVSTASSTTIQGEKDTANDTIGEYHNVDFDEDFIDWDEDDSLTTQESEHSNPPTEGDDTLNTVYGETNETKDEHDNLHLGSEDFLNGSQDLPHIVPEEENEHDYDEDFLDFQEHEEEHLDQADEHLPPQQETEGHQDYQDYHDGDEHHAENDEQFHTAYSGGVAGQNYEQEAEQPDFAANAANPQDSGEYEEEEFDDTVIIHRPEDQDDGAADNDQNQEGDVFEDIGYDDDDDDYDSASHHQPVGTAVATGEAATSTNSPSGKRSFDEIDDPSEDESSEMPEVKKVRSS